MKCSDLSVLYLRPKANNPLGLFQRILPRILFWQARAATISAVFVVRNLTARRAPLSGACLTAPGEALVLDLW